ncbi:S9 family peptidase [Marinilabiliaceae bacterium JC017]|nr:S9 family peptidase [Marinilabiliaceae bacterium JC017]
MTIRTKLLTGIGLFFICGMVGAKEVPDKKPLTFSDYNQWKSLRSEKISNDGKWISYEINPQEGDGWLYLYDKEKATRDSVARGKKAVFAAGSEFWAFNVVAQADSIKQLKLDKVKKDKFPKDSLFVRNLTNGVDKAFSLVKSFKVPKDGGDWLAISFDKAAAPKDTISKKEETDKADKKKKKAFKSEGTPLVFYRPSTGDSLCVEQATKFAVAKNGNAAYAVQSIGDSTEHSVVLKFSPATWRLDTLFKATGKIEKIASAYQGDQCAFLFSNDTTKRKVYRLYHWDEKMKEPVMLVDTLHPALPDTWSVNTKASLYFSKNGRRLFFGAGERLQPEKKDTLTKEEKVHLDVWNWQDIEIQPMQKKHLSKNKDRAYLCVCNLKDNKLFQLESEDLLTVDIQEEGDLDMAVGYNSKPYKRATSWNGEWASDIYLVNLNTGKKSMLKERQYMECELSFDGKWFVWYEPADSGYYSKNIETGIVKALTKGLDVPFFYEEHDTPSEPDPYGIVGWSADKKSVIVYDRFDIWQLDLAGKKRPVCLTKNQGRNNHIRFRYNQLDPEEKGIDLKNPVLLKAFNEKNKQSGFYQLTGKELKPLTMGAYKVYSAKKAKKAGTVLWHRSTVRHYPELEVTDLSFSKSKIISNTNPQQDNYIWSDVQLVEWVASDGLVHQGLLYTPENLDKTKKYPVVVYFYERNSDDLYRHSTPRPSRSVINKTFYNSNGYVVFVPDIFYRAGDPGLCAYEAVVSGTLAMADRFSFIDRERVGIQGQSWGGYQVAFLVTRTNMFRAGMAGAPVSNMTSAYGGIRWGTGMSRQFQYEHTQSRIGGTLWEKTNKYIENSPVFFAPQVETPLLMMHNDNDGAVPWYQGIEYFMALRRLDKPAWLLVYNDEEHNLTRRANCKDLSRRMMQFFDHYLKEKPMPVWMKDGLPAVDKGMKMGYEYVEE